ncbi:MAG: hypothetical protein R8J84_04285, partial [Mariprofundales bacterium]
MMNSATNTVRGIFVGFAFMLAMLSGAWSAQAVATTPEIVSVTLGTAATPVTVATGFNLAVPNMNWATAAPTQQPMSGIFIVSGASSGDAYTAAPTGLQGASFTSAPSPMFGVASAGMFGAGLIQFTQQSLSTMFTDQQPTNANPQIFGSATGPVAQSAFSLANAGIPAGTTVVFTINMNGLVPQMVTIMGDHTTPTANYDPAGFSGQGSLIITTATFKNNNAALQMFDSTVGFMIATDANMAPDPNNPSQPLGIIAQANHWVGDMFPELPGFDSNAAVSGNGGAKGSFTAKCGTTFYGPAGETRTITDFMPNSSLTSYFGTKITGGNLTTADLAVFVDSPGISVENPQGAVLTADTNFGGLAGTKLVVSYSFASPKDIAFGVSSSIANTGTTGTTGTGTIIGTVTNLSSATTGTIFVGVSTDPNFGTIANYATVGSTGGTFTVSNLPDNGVTDLYVSAYVDLNNNQLPDANEPSGDFGGGTSAAIRLATGGSAVADVVIQDVQTGGSDPYGALNPTMWSRADFNNDPYVIFTPRIDQNINSSMLNPVADGTVDEWTINPFGQGDVTIVLGAIDSDFLIDQGGFSKLVYAGTTGSITVPSAAAIKVTVQNMGNASTTGGSPYHYQLAVIGASQMFVKQDNLSPNAYSNESSTPELGAAGAVTRWYYEMPISATTQVQFDWSAKASFPDGGAFAGGANNDIVGSVDLYAIPGGNIWTGTPQFVQHLGNSLSTAGLSTVLPDGNAGPTWYFVEFMAAASGTVNANNHYTISATTGVNPQRAMVHRLRADSFDPANYNSPANGAGSTGTTAGFSSTPVLMADFEDSAGAILGSVPADQAWIDPYTLDMNNLPTATTALDGLVSQYDPTGSNMVTLGGTASAPGHGYLLHLRAYAASGANATSGQPEVLQGDPILREASAILMDLTDTMQDPTNFVTLTAGWYVRDQFGAQAYVGGFMSSIQPGMVVTTLMAVDTVDVYSNFMSDNRPQVIDSAIAFDAMNQMATITTTTALTDWYTANSSALVLHQVAFDHYSLPGFVFVLQAYNDSNGDGRIDAGGQPALMGTQELLYLPSDPYGVTMNGAAVPTDWSLHSYNDVLKQDVFTAVAGGESVPMQLAATQPAAGATSSPAPTGGFGAPAVKVTLNQPRVALALLDFDTGAIGYQVDISNSVTMDSGYTQILTLDGYAAALSDPNLPPALAFDPLNPSAGSGYVFKVVAYDDANANGLFDAGETALEANKQIVNIYTDAIAPDGTPVVAGTWGEFDPLAQTVAAVSGAYTLQSYDSVFASTSAGSQGGGSGASIRGTLANVAGNPVGNL